MFVVIRSGNAAEDGPRSLTGFGNGRKVQNRTAQCGGFIEIGVQRQIVGAPAPVHVTGNDRPGPEKQTVVTIAEFQRTVDGSVIVEYQTGTAAPATAAEHVVPRAPLSVEIVPLFTTLFRSAVDADTVVS